MTKEERRKKNINIFKIGHREKRNKPQWKGNRENKTGIPTTLNQRRSERWANDCYVYYYEVWCEWFCTGKKRNNASNIWNKGETRDKHLKLLDYT